MFFFKQKAEYEMRISDGSSDVCSSDLADLIRKCFGLELADFGLQNEIGPQSDGFAADRYDALRILKRFDHQCLHHQRRHVRPSGTSIVFEACGRARKSVVWGKSVSVRVDLVGSSTMKKKKKYKK